MYRIFTNKSCRHCENEGEKDFLSLQKKRPAIQVALFILISFASVFQAKAQVNVDDNVTAATLVEKLVGHGITYLNPTLNCAQGASAFFTTVSSNLNMDSGIVLTTGKAKTNTATFTVGINGDQTLYFAANSNGTPGDPELTQLSGNPTFDACVLEFDFVPDGDTLLFDYNFGSEEYQSYSCSPFNDVFAFFISGPGIPTTQNIALIPGTSIPVSINSTTSLTVNNPFNTVPCTSLGTGSPFSQYYVDNSVGTTITYYGFTHGLTARAGVLPCSTYHIKLAIADGSDPTLDSGVFLAANSFRSNKAVPSFQSSLGIDKGYLVEGCTHGTVTFKSTLTKPYPQTVYVDYGGTATAGVDYASGPTTLSIPAFDTMATFDITPIQDNNPEGVETIIVKMINPCNNLTLDSIEFKVYDYLPITMLSVDTMLCQGMPVRLQAGDDTDFLYHWSAMPAGNIADSLKIKTSGYPDTSTQYTVYATFQGCSSLPLTFNATVEPTPIPQILTLDTTVCLRDSMQLRVAIGPSYFSNYTYTWSPGLNLSDPFVREPKFFSQKVFDWKYVISAQTPLGCTGTDSIMISSRPPMDLVNVTPDTIVKYGNSLQLHAEGADYYVWTPTLYLNDPNIAEPVSQPEEPVVYTVYAANHWGCRDTGVVKVAIDYNMSEYIPNAFSPNGDGLNDEFKVFSVRYQKLLEFRVFNRWGQEVFSTTDINKGWDGNYHGTPQEMGIYNYIIRVSRPDGQIKTYKGDLTLIR